MPVRPYIFPPRPENKFPASDLDYYDDMEMFMAQPKLNGSCSEVYTSPDQIKVMGRERNVLSNMKMSYDEFYGIFGDSDNLICGEYMNKSKKDVNNKTWNQKFVIFDMLVAEGKYMLGTTFKERYELLQSLYTPIDETDYLYKISENIWMVKAFFTNFKEIWNEIIKIDMFEGLVFKQIDGKLERGARKVNNNKTQLKCRKPTKNYGC